jgi:integrase
MASAWIEKRATKESGARYCVRYRIGGRESALRFGGSFRTMREAKTRRDAIGGDLAARRVPDVLIVERPASTRTLAVLAEAWRASRVDVAEGTAATHRVNLGRILPRLGDRAVDSLEAADVAQLVAELVDEGLARESIRKTRATLAMVLDFAEVQPNPARHKSVKLPFEDRVEIQPPTAAHVLAVLPVLPTGYRLPVLVLDATGMRVGELEGLTWGDVDEHEGRWRVSAAVAKTSRARWIDPPAVLFDAVSALCPRDDRAATRRVFDGVTADRLRTAIARACTAAGVPAFSPHDLRHRRATLWHLGGVPAAQAASWLGHSAQEHLRTYAHAVLERTELDYAVTLATCTDGDRSVLTRRTESGDLQG